MPWPTVDELADHIGSAIDAEAFASAQSAIDAAISLVKAEAHQDIDVDTETLVLPGTWDSELWLPQVPVTAIASVSINRPPLPTQLLGPLTYTWNASGRVLSRFTYGGGGSMVEVGRWGTWAGPYATITIGYTHGWTLTPAPLRTIVLDVAGRRFLNPTGFITNDQVGDRSVTMAAPDSDPATLTPAEARIARLLTPPRR